MVGLANSNLSPIVMTTWIFEQDTRLFLQTRLIPNRIEPINWVPQNVPTPTIVLFHSVDIKNDRRQPSCR